MKKTRFRWFLGGTLTGLVMMTLLSFDNYFEISKNIEIFSAVMRELNIYYVDEIKPGDLTKKGIDGMLESLDPYTVYIPETAIEDHKMSITGQYGGIGSTVRKSGDYLMIAEPYEDSPAAKSGLKPGDIVLNVNGQSTKGKDVDDVVKVMRGAPNTTVTLTIKRGEEVKDYSITREEIKIKNVPYAGMIDSEIGYIKLQGFTEDAGKEVGEALKDLKSKNALKGVVLDLRGNPGGLLREAVNVVNVFVDKQQLVVTTKGKVEEWNKTYKTLNPAVDATIPLVVLVDRGSASASEIVSGTIQDLDRGVIIGQRSFGKGLVQVTRQMNAYNTQIKLTTSKYYIPSGRCIQALDYTNKNADGSVHTIPDSLRSKFTTKGGRVVYDGGGVYPDISIKPHKYSTILISLVQKNFIFDYATIYQRKHEKIASAREFKFTDEDYNDFVAFLKDKNYEYKTESEKKLDEFKEISEKEKYFKELEVEFNALLEKKKSSKSNDLFKFKDEIKEFLIDEIVSRYYYRRGRVEVSLDIDAEIKEALVVLKDVNRYKQILSKDYEIKLIDYKAEDFEE